MLPAALVAGGVLVLLVTSDPGGGEWRQYFGRWRLRNVLLALVAFGAAGYLAAALHSARSLATALFVTALGVMSWLLLEIPGLLGLVSYPTLLGNHELIPTNDLASKPRPHEDVRGETFFDIAMRWGIDHPGIPFHYQTDRHGFRNPDDPDSADIYVLGDSIVVGAAVPHERTAAARLAAETGRSAMSVALIGISPAKEQRLFEEAALPVEGRLVLQFVFEGNDLQDTRQERLAENGSSDAERGPSLAERSFAKNLDLALLRWTQPEVSVARRRSCQVGDERVLFLWTGAPEGYDAERDRLLEDLSGFASRVANRGGRYAVVFVPTKLRVYAPHCAWPPDTELADPSVQGLFPDWLSAWSARSGVPVVDLTDPLAEALAQGRAPWFWGDTHWNEIGHEVAARAVARSGPVVEWLAGAPSR